jgi:hypothetical protein
MTTNDSKLVRLPNRLIDRIDRRRGKLSRVEYIDRLLDREAARARPRAPVMPRFKGGDR